MTPGEMQAMRRAGFTYKEIGRKAGIPWGTVRSRCKAWGVEPEEKPVRSRRRPVKNNHPRWLIHMLYWDCELSIVDIAYELDIPQASVGTMMRRLNIPCRTRKQADKLRRKKHPYYVTPVLSTERAKEMAAKALVTRKRKADRRERDRQRNRRRRKRIRATSVDSGREERTQVTRRSSAPASEAAEAA